MGNPHFSISQQHNVVKCLAQKIYKGGLYEETEMVVDFRVHFYPIYLAACQSKAAIVQKVRIAEVTRSIFYAPQYVAIEKGFFEEEGLEIELTTVPGGDKTMTALISGGADVALVGAETSIYVNSQGTEDPIINFAQLTQTDGTFLVSIEKLEEISGDMLKDKT